MITGTDRERRPAEVWPPAAFILEEMEYRAWTTGDLSQRSGIPIEELRGILDGRLRVSIPMAQGLASAFGTSYRLWLGLQDAWDESLIHELNKGTAK